MRYQSTNFQTVGGWIGRIFRLDFSVFTEIRADRSATTAAIFVVLVSSFVAGLGSWLWALQHDEFQGVDGTEVLLKSLVLGGIIQTAVWFLWVYLVYQVLARAYSARIEFAELIRTMGFAFVPVALNILIFIAGIAVPIGVISFAMVVLFTNIAIQHATDVEAREATMANLTGFTAFALLMGGFANVFEVGTFGGLAPGIFFFALDF